MQIFGNINTAVSPLEGAKQPAAPIGRRSLEFQDGSRRI